MVLDAIQTLESCWDEFRGIFRPDISQELAAWRWSKPTDFRDPMVLEKGFSWSNSRGVYAFVGAPSASSRNGSIIYIGKATMNSTFGNRVWSHLRVVDGRIEFAKQDHGGNDATHVTVLEFQAPYVPFAVALEEWLIGRLKPFDNRQGVRS
jgi:hypothetical protein